MTPGMYVATLAWLLLILGYSFRRRRRLHVPLVLSGILSDIMLVLYLQATRNAVQTALRFEREILEQIHIGFSTGALLLYFPVVWLGCKLLCGENNAALRMKHARLAQAALVLRTLGFIFMFSMWNE